MINIDQNLISRYAVQLPRYTSYPTALEFSLAYASDRWLHDLNEQIASASKKPLSLYCHIPFCRSLCYFCACNKIIAKDRSQVSVYIKAITQEIQSYGRLFSETAPAAQLHWGGGSPNFLMPEEMRRLFAAVKESFPRFLDDADISIELDPRTTTHEQLKTLRELGFNRVSFGVQDFNAEVQEAINRIQSFESTQSLCSEARSLGFSGINVDLIYGLPLQTAKTFSETLKLVAQLKPDRIALYGYAHVTWIKKVQKVFDKLPLPTSPERIKLFSDAVSFLSDAGYEYIGMDHFALPADSLTLARKSGSMHRNFMGYSTHKTETLLSFGISAISSIPAGYAQNERSMQGYLKKIEAGNSPVERGISRGEEDRWRGALIQDVMCREVLNFSEFKKTWGIDILLLLKQINLEDLISDGLVKLSQENLTVTPLGKYFLRNIAARFDTYLTRHVTGQAGDKKFSQAI